MGFVALDGDTMDSHTPPRPVATPLSRSDLRSIVRDADEKLRQAAIHEAKAGRTRCRFMTRHNQKVELAARLERLFPGCAVYLDPATARDTYGTCSILVDWS
jgi:hypothetical protein